MTCRYDGVYTSTICLMVYVLTGDGIPVSDADYVVTITPTETVLCSYLAIVPPHIINFESLNLIGYLIKSHVQSPFWQGPTSINYNDICIYIYSSYKSTQHKKGLIIKAKINVL